MKVVLRYLQSKVSTDFIPSMQMVSFTGSFDCDMIVSGCGILGAGFCFVGLNETVFVCVLCLFVLVLICYLRLGVVFVSGCVIIVTFCVRLVELSICLFFECEGVG